MLIGVEVMTTELEMVVDPAVGGEETLRVTRCKLGGVASFIPAPCPQPTRSPPPRCRVLSRLCGWAPVKTDSPAEGAGFEPLVPPPQRGQHFSRPSWNPVGRSGKFSP